MDKSSTVPDLDVGTLDSMYMAYKVVRALMIAYGFKPASACVSRPESAYSLSFTGRNLSFHIHSIGLMVVDTNELTALRASVLKANAQDEIQIKLVEFDLCNIRHTIALIRALRSFSLDEIVDDPTVDTYAIEFKTAEAVLKKYKSGAWILAQTKHPYQPITL